MLNGMDGNSRRTAASQPRSTEADERPETINIESVIDEVEVTPMMGRVSVFDARVETIAYAAESRGLEIAFKSGQVWQLFDVPPVMRCTA
jgi:hypothetical protein